MTSRQRRRWIGQLPRCHVCQHVIYCWKQVLVWMGQSVFSGFNGLTEPQKLPVFVLHNRLIAHACQVSENRCLPVVFLSAAHL